MVKQAPFAIVYADEIYDHLRAIESKYHSLISTTIDEQLLYEPDVATRNRKPLTRPIAFGAAWELRLGPDNRFRIFYDVDLELRTVLVLAIGVKDRNRLIIGSEEFKE